MNNSSLLFAFVVLFIAGCAAKTVPPPPVAIEIPEKRIDYTEEVKPILVKRCVVCHSCYNSPCQLKLSSYEGLDRGATKKAVYNSYRLKTMDPTRLFIDAENTAGWRKKGFHSVRESSAPDGYNNSFMIQLLAHKMKNPVSVGEYRSEAKDLTCAETGEELGVYLEKHPNGGMPFGFPPLKKKEFQTVAGWLAQGGHGPSREERARLEKVSPADGEMIARWEDFLNRDDAKYAMTARYLYEHLFLAHLTFQTGSNDFFELVRSRTPPGEPVRIIPTVRPYDDPGGKFFYRFRKIHSTIVHKTHMVFEFGQDQKERITELFIEPEWLLPPHREKYDQKTSANPFIVFEQIPPASRYQFLLDNVQYIIMTFIRGPVCKGQIALNVIHDVFWVFFMNPEYDLSVRFPGFLKDNEQYLDMPAGATSGAALAKGLITREFRKNSATFARIKQNYYSMQYRYRGLGPEAIWPGNRESDSPALTVFRHFDSASVLRGVRGALPKTMWVIDFPLLERIYYSLVAGFDVYGTALHQLATRIYMDELRQEGEVNFLNFLPEEVRGPVLSDWYGGMSLGNLDYIPSKLPAGFHFSTADPKREFTEYLVDHYFNPDLRISFDKNYLRDGEQYPKLPTAYVTIDDYIRGFKAVSAPGVSFFRKVADHNANLAYVRIRVPEQEDVVISAIINRWHDDVSTLFEEEDQLCSEKDSATFIEGFVGSYPNYFFDVNLADLPEFLRVLDEYDSGRQSKIELEKFGVNRADENFWETYDWFQRKFNESDPVHSGLFDLNRYYYLAM
ncbi:fatty acid cis/trans isomerase [Desulfomarina sp.]